MSVERPCVLILGALVWAILLAFGVFEARCQLNNPFSFNTFIGGQVN